MNEIQAIGTEEGLPPIFENLKIQDVKGVFKDCRRNKKSLLELVLSGRIIIFPAAVIKVNVFFVHFYSSCE